MKVKDCEKQLTPSDLSKEDRVLLALEDSGRYFAEKVHGESYIKAKPESELLIQIRSVLSENSASPSEAVRV
jgi:hypothetical protein